METSCGVLYDKSLNGQERANILKKCLTELHSTGIIIASITFDGLGANLLMADCLGAKLTTYPDIKVWFPYPETCEPVFIFFWIPVT